MTNHTRRCVRLLLGPTLLGLVVGTSACGAPDSAERRAANGDLVRDSAGVRIVEWRAADASEQLIVEPAPPEDLVPELQSAAALNAVSAVVAVDSQRALVADGRPARLLLFDFGRNELRVVGASGGGPGEYRAILWVERDRGGDGFLAFDHILARLTRYTPDLSVSGVLRPGQIPTGLGGAPSIRGAASDGRYIASSPLLPRAAGPASLVRQPLRLFVLAADGSVGDSIVTVLGDEALVIDGIVTRPPFVKRTSILVDADRIHVSDGNAYEIRTYGLDGKLRQIARGAPATRPVPDTLLARFRQSGALLPTAVHFPETSGLLIDDRGRLWVGRVAEAGLPTEWTVATADGARVATVLTPPGFRLMSVWRGLLLGVARDADEVEKVAMLMLPNE